MIPPWREALERAFAAIAPGGRLHVVDFGELEELPAWFRRLLYAARALRRSICAPDLAERDAGTGAGVSRGRLS